jgi:hypothetical protein
MKKALLHFLMSGAMLLMGTVPSFACPPQHDVPEPATMSMMGIFVAGLIAYRSVKGRK